jgi:hypothetical protein
MQAHTTEKRPNYRVPEVPDERQRLLKEVDFKWLMAGQGWWIDTDRLHNDPSYAAHLLDLVEVTKSAALKDCAALLRTQVGTQQPCALNQASARAKPSAASSLR